MRRGQEDRSTGPSTGKRRRGPPQQSLVSPREDTKRQKRGILFEPSSLGLEPDELFFELANAPVVRYRCGNGTELAVSQFQDIKDCTGGVVWETSYCLAAYLSQRTPRPVPGAVLEVGAGCGLLGLVLAAEWSAHVVISDRQQAIELVRRNVAANGAKVTAEAAVLDWEVQTDREALRKRDYDYIVGTDVVFAVRLVKPLLETLRALATPNTIVLLCVQERCADAHSALLDEIPRFFQKCRSLTDELIHMTGPCGRLAKETECVLLELRGVIPA